MRTNVAPIAPRTHEGGPAVRMSPADELRRTVMACLLWEDGFYESGVEVGERIKALVPKCAPVEVAQMAVEARTRQHLRHAPLLLARELARHPARAPDGLIADTLAEVIRRADELAEFLALYWKDGRQPLAKQVKKGLARAFRKFDEYALAKYNRDNAVRLRDVLFMVHAKPKDDEQAALWRRLVDGQLAPAGTWEERLSAGADKRETFESMLREGSLGYLALLRNLRNMREAGVDKSLVFDALEAGAAKSRVLPFRFVAAARAVPQWEPAIDKAMQLALAGAEKLPGTTIVLVDVSVSMRERLSRKSDLSRMDAAATLAALARGVCEAGAVFTFSNKVVGVPPRSGMAMVDAVIRSQDHGLTYLGGAIESLRHDRNLQDADRIIVITDEQSQDRVGGPIGRGYMVNVATDKNGVGYGDWTRISGLSESIISYIVAFERA